MVNILIYTGLSIMLIGSLFGIYTAIKGIRTGNNNRSGKYSIFNLLQSGPMNPEIKKLIAIWGIIMIIGFLIIGIGLAIGLK